MACSKSPHHMEDVLGPAVVALCLGLLFTRVVFYSWIVPTLICCAPITFQIILVAVQSFFRDTCELFRVSESVTFGMMVLTGHVCPCELLILTLFQFAASLMFDFLQCPIDAVLLEHALIILATQATLNFVALVFDAEERNAFRLELQFQNSLSAQAAMQRQCKESLRRPWPEDVLQRVVLHPMERAFDFHSLVCICVVEFKTQNVWRGAIPPPQVLKLLRKVHATLDGSAVGFGCEPFFRQPLEYCCVSGVNASKDPMGHISDFASTIHRQLHCIASEFGVAIEASVGLSAGWALTGLVGTRSVAHTIWGHCYGDARDCARQARPGTVELSAAWAAIMDSYQLAQHASANISGASTPNKANGGVERPLASLCVASSSTSEGEGLHRVPTCPSSPPPVVPSSPLRLSPLALEPEEGEEGTAADTTLDSGGDDPAPQKTLSRSLLGASHSDEADGKAAGTPFWGKWLSRLNSARADGQRSSLVASIDPRGLVGYAMEMVEGLSPAGSRSPTPPPYSASEFRASGASDFWSDVALADSSRRTSMDFTLSLPELACHERLVTFQVIPGQAGIKAKVSIIIPTAVLGTPRCRPVYNNGHITLPGPQEAAFREAQAMPRPRLTAAVVFLLLVPNLGLAVMGDTLVVTPIASLSFVLLCALAIAVATLLPVRRRRWQALLCYRLACHLLMCAPAVSLFAVSSHQVSTGPACLFVLDFLMSTHLLWPSCNLPRVLISQLLHVMAFGVVQLLLALIFMPVEFNHRASATVPLDLSLPDVAPFGAVLMPAVLIMGFLGECASAFRRRAVFVATTANGRAVEAVERGVRYLDSLLQPHRRALGGRPVPDAPEDFCDVHACGTVVAVWLPFCAALDEPAHEGEAGQHWMRSAEVKLQRLLLLHEALDETLDGEDAPLVPAYSNGDVYLAHTPLGRGARRTGAILDLALQWAALLAPHGPFRIAVTTGPLSGGFFGPAGKEAYFVVGDAVARATRCAVEMEEEVLIDEATKGLLDHNFLAVGADDVPGMYRLLRQRAFAPATASYVSLDRLTSAVEQEAELQPGRSLRRLGTGPFRLFRRTGAEER
eukprot:EG_transcript_1086